MSSWVSTLINSESDRDSQVLSVLTRKESHLIFNDCKRREKRLWFMFVLYLPSLIVAARMSCTAMTNNTQVSVASARWVYHELKRRSPTSLHRSPCSLHPAQDPSMINQLLSWTAVLTRREKRALGRSSREQLNVTSAPNSLARTNTQPHPAPRETAMQSPHVLRMEMIQKHLLNSTNKLLWSTSLITWYLVHCFPNAKRAHHFTKGDHVKVSSNYGIKLKTQDLGVMHGNSYIWFGRGSCWPRNQ